MYEPAVPGRSDASEGAYDGPVVAGVRLQAGGIALEGRGRDPGAPGDQMKEEKSERRRRREEAAAASSSS